MTDEWNLQTISKFFEEPPFEIEDESQVAEIYETLVQADEDRWKKLEDAHHIQLTGILYNFSEDLGREGGLDRIIELNEGIEQRDLSKVHQALRHYQLANAYSLRDSWSKKETAYTFFDSDDLIHAIGHARASIAEEYRTEIWDHRLIQSYVNFANFLSRIGRVCEAFIWYNKAVNMDPEFGMALGNRGQCKMNYAAILFSQNHSSRFLHSAYKDFEQALENSEDLTPRAEKMFKGRMEAIDEYSDKELDIEKHDEYELGDSEFDKDYHQWVLDHHLYLNPLNDIYTHTSTAHDPFHLPNMLMPDDKEFPYPGIRL